jgi:hypothetical protein
MLNFRLLLLVSLVVVATVACGDDGAAELFPAACNLPSPSPGAAGVEIPDEFDLIEGTVVRYVTEEGGVTVYAVNVPAGIEEIYDAYRDGLDDDRFELIDAENEGFEAELYWRDSERGGNVAFQARNPGCDDASSGFLTLGKVSSPVGEGVRP